MFPHTPHIESVNLLELVERPAAPAETESATPGAIESATPQA